MIYKMYKCLERLQERGSSVLIKILDTEFCLYTLHYSNVLKRHFNIFCHDGVRSSKTADCNMWECVGILFIEIAKIG